MGLGGYSTPKTIVNYAAKHRIEIRHLLIRNVDLCSRGVSTSYPLPGMQPLLFVICVIIYVGYQGNTNRHRTNITTLTINDLSF